MIDLSSIDKFSFSNRPFSKKVEKPWGYEIIFTPPHLSYTGKIMHIQAGKRLSLQIHDRKQESWILKSGQAKIVWENQNGELIETDLQENEGFTCAIGQKHRLVGITDCDIFEVSTPEIGTTYRLEDDFKRPDETEQIRAEMRNEK
ncbi:MAG: cupin [Candidatus Levybacteria bacterium]|nr:cupin [Candidatus Levybacteria bacterium]